MTSAIAENTVNQMDALDLLRALPEASVDLIFTDPPYGHNNNNGDLIHMREVALGGTLKAARPIASDGIEANELLCAVLPEFARVLVPGGVLCCCCAGGGGTDPQFARWSLWIDGTRGLEFKQMVVWDKGPIGMGWHYRRSYETVLVAQRKGAPCRWYDTTNAVENVIRPGYGAPKIIPRADQHPTEKPVGLAEIFIKLHTRPGDLVVDPFCGSGTTGVAARQLDRRFIMGDTSEEYVAIARRRVTEPFTPQMFPDTPTSYGTADTDLSSSQLRLPLAMSEIHDTE